MARDDSHQRTDPRLLERLKQHGAAADWQRFDNIYRDYVLHVVREFGINKSDAEDVVQEVMLGVVAALDTFEYDPAKGSFRGWLKTMAHRRAIDFLRQNPRTKHLFVAPQSDTGSTAFIEKIADNTSAAAGESLDHDYHRQLLLVAMEQLENRVEKRQLEAFRLVALQGVAAKEVAAQYGVSVEQLYVWKTRILARLRKLFRGK